MNDPQPRLPGMGGHQSAHANTDEWLTPPWLLAAVGGAQSFDLDPCAPVYRPWDMARSHLTIREDGLSRRWDGRVWLNSPYGDAVAAWMMRLAQHGNGLGLVFARTETEAFHTAIWPLASAILFLRGRLHFHRPEAPAPERCLTRDHVWVSCPDTGKIKVCKFCGRAKANGGAPSVLVAYGADEMDRLAEHHGVLGHFTPLRLPHSHVVAALDSTWRDAILSWLKTQVGPVSLADLYRALSSHPKARRNPHYRAKIRQSLQRGPFRRVAPGVWAGEPA